MNRIPGTVHASILWRTLMIQASWNYRTLIGTGMAFALLPLRRHLQSEGVPDRVDLTVHAAHFNAHPYLASAALGSLARMEVEGASVETITRFRDAVRGPLGALGDRLIWAAWLPVCAVFALALFFAGTPPGFAVAAFLFPYNIGHVLLRIWGYRVGWKAGPRLGMQLRESGLPRIARRLDRLLLVALGLLVGVVAAVGLGGGAGTLETAQAGSRAGLPSGPTFWGPGLLGLVVGITLGPRAWKPAAMVVAGVVGLVLVSGWVRLT